MSALYLSKSAEKYNRPFLQHGDKKILLTEKRARYLYPLSNYYFQKNVLIEMNKYFRMRCLKAEIHFGPQLRPKIGSSFLEDILGMEFITWWEIHATFSQPLVIKIDFLILSSIS